MLFVSTRGPNCHFAAWAMSSSAPLSGCAIVFVSTSTVWSIVFRASPYL
jgi:hypothetical protein